MVKWTPAGERVNEKGIKYYDDLINMLLTNKITPIVTLYHWDLPQVRSVHPIRGLSVVLSISLLFLLFSQVLQETYGGWQNVSMVNYFNDFANLCFERFGNRVRYWITFNNPWVSRAEERGCIDRPLWYLLTVGSFPPVCCCGRIRDRRTCSWSETEGNRSIQSCS